MSSTIYSKSKKIKSFSKSWWDKLDIDSGDMTFPITIKNTISDDVSELKESVYEMLRNLKNGNDFLGWRIWVDGKQDERMKKAIIDDPIKNEDDLIPWQKRNFGNKKFGIILNNGQRYSNKARKLISNYFAPFLDKKPPFGGINFSIFIGNYGWTPIGIHEDHTGSFVMHFHLGPGNKTMYMWERTNYKENLMDKENDTQPKKHLPFADYVCHLEKGDVFFMPWNYYHIGKSDNLSLGLTVWFNYTTVDGLLNGIWESGLKEISEESINDEYIAPNIKEINDTAAIDSTLSKLDEDVVEESLRSFLLEELDDYTNALISNDWYDGGHIKDKKGSIELQENTLLKVNLSKIYCVRSGNDIKFFHRGDKVSFNYHKDMENLVELLNEGNIRSVENILIGLFNDWPKEVGVRILEILCENGFLQILKK